MKQWTQKQLEEEGYMIINMIVEKVDISMKDHGVAVLEMTLKGSGFICVYGGYVLGHGYLRAKHFDGSNSGMESILRIMDVVGAETFIDMEGKYVRAAFKSWNDSLKLIGNILDDKWFDIDSFFDDKQKELESEPNEEVTEKETDNWILCSKELPRLTGLYIVTQEDRSGYREVVAKWSSSHCRWYTTFDNDNWERVVAWMPFPKKPYIGDLK